MSPREFHANFCTPWPAFSRTGSLYMHGDANRALAKGGVQQTAANRSNRVPKRTAASRLHCTPVFVPPRRKKPENMRPISMRWRTTCRDCVDRLWALLCKRVESAPRCLLPQPPSDATIQLLDTTDLCYLRGSAHSHAGGWLGDGRRRLGRAFCSVRFGE